MADSAGDYVKNIADDVKLIVQSEIALAKAEVVPSVKKMGVGSGILGAAAYVAANMLSLLFLAVAFCLSWLLGAFTEMHTLLALTLGFLASAILVGIVAVALVLIAKPKFQFKGPDAAIKEGEATSAAVSTAAKRGLAYVESDQMLEDHKVQRALAIEKSSFGDKPQDTL